MTDRMRKCGLFLGIVLFIGLVAKIFFLGDTMPEKEEDYIGEEYVSFYSLEYDFFAEYRLQREITRSKEVDLLKDIIGNDNYDPDVRKKAQLDLLNLIKKMEKELESENLIMAKGAKDAVVIICDDGVNVVVKVDGSIEEYIPKIGDATAKITGRTLGEISIISH